MSKVANLIKDGKNEGLVLAKDLKDEDRNKEFICPCCANPMFLRICDKKEKHFAGFHSENCFIANEQYRISVAANDYILGLDAILKHKDTPIKGEEHSDAAVAANPIAAKTKEAEKPFELFRSGSKILRSVTSIYNYIKSISLGDLIDIESGLTVSDFILDERTIYKCRKNGFDDEVRLVVATRTAPSRLTNPPRKDGYILLRDAFSRNDNEAIYFLVKLNEASQFKKFKELLFGTVNHPEKKSSKKHIVLLANWKRISDTAYHVYYADLNAKSYAFVD